MRPVKWDWIRHAGTGEQGKGGILPIWWKLLMYMGNDSHQGFMGVKS